MVHVKRFRQNLGCVICTLCVAICVLRCSGITPVGDFKQTKVDLGEKHPLNNQIWDVGQKKFISEALLIQRLQPVAFVLLGEKHDNALHHKLQARLLQALIKKGRKPTLAWEMFTKDQEVELRRHLTLHPEDAKGIGQAVGWKSRSGISWEIYQPIAEVAISASLQQVHADLSLASGTPAPGKSQVDSTLAWLPVDLEQALAKEIEASHCGQATAKMVQSMVKVQQARDAYMAEQITAHAHPEYGAVFIAGAEHVRQDRGVPFFLRRQQDVMKDAIASLAMVEVQPDKRQAKDYEHRTRSEVKSFDYIWFTTRAFPEDPCVKFEKRLKNMKKFKNNPK